MKRIFIDDKIKEDKLLINILDKNNEIIIFKSNNEIINADYVITKNKEMDNDYNTLIYDDFINDILRFYFNDYINNYDYNFLYNSINSIESQTCENLIVGSSYSRKGIEEEDFNRKTMNLSLSSQDLYYACLLARTVIKNNENIKNVFIGTGYYTFYHDISKSTGLELSMVNNIYNPLLNDTHNAEESNNAEGYNNKQINYYNKYNDILDKYECYKAIKEIIVNYIGNKYYNKMITRDNTRIDIGEEEDWDKLSDDIRMLHCVNRTNQHNKFVNYQDSLKENIEILNDFVEFCNGKNINVTIITFPFSKYYLENISEIMKIEYMDALNKINGKINYIDFNNLDIFDEGDFLDMDHLNLKGAKKLTNILSSIEF